MIGFLGLSLIFLVLILGLIGSGVVIGLILHWIIPAIDLGTGTLIGVVAAGFSIHYFNRLLRISEELRRAEPGDEPDWSPEWGLPPGFPAGWTRKGRRRRR